MICLIIIGLLLYYFIPRKVSNTTTVKEVVKPIETTITKVDSITKVNNTIINNIHKIDSIKHETITKIKSLSDDSTLIVFYELLQDKDI